MCMHVSLCVGMYVPMNTGTYLHGSEGDTGPLTLELQSVVVAQCGGLETEIESLTVLHSDSPNPWTTFPVSFLVFSNLLLAADCLKLPILFFLPPRDYKGAIRPGLCGAGDLT